MDIPHHADAGFFFEVDRYIASFFPINIKKEL
jgi:hypothetical protein